MSTTEDWAGDLGRRWAAEAEEQDRLLGAFEAAGLAALGPVAGLRVLDLGCGPGASSLALARAGAWVTGLDVSPDLLAIARRRAEAAAETGVAFVQADAAEAPPAGPFDAMFSRFGCMFFEAPGRAWARLRGVMVPGAPFAGVAWREVKANPWVLEPLKLVGDLLDPVARPPAGAPGPFGWADPALPRGWLEAAGWREPRFEAAEAELALAPDGPGAPEARAAASIMAIGPLSRRIGDLDAARRDEARRRLEDGLGRFVREGAVRLSGAVWVATARA